jgi:predicted ATPase
MKASGRVNSKEHQEGRLSGDSWAKVGREVGSTPERKRDLRPSLAVQKEIGLLRHRWEYAKDGEGQLILLSGPAGFGKSRIVQDFREGLDSSSSVCLQYFGSPFHIVSPFYPFTKQLEWAAGFVRTEPPGAMWTATRSSHSARLIVRQSVAFLTSDIAVASVEENGR